MTRLWLRRTQKVILLRILQVVARGDTLRFTITRKIRRTTIFHASRASNPTWRPDTEIGNIQYLTIVKRPSHPGSLWASGSLSWISPFSSCILSLVHPFARHSTSVRCWSFRSAKTVITTRGPNWFEALQAPRIARAVIRASCILARGIRRNCEHNFSGFRWSDKNYFG